MDRYNRITAIVLTTEHLFDLTCLYLNLKSVKSGQQIFYDVFSLTCPFDQDREILNSLA